MNGPSVELLLQCLPVVVLKVNHEVPHEEQVGRHWVEMGDVLKRLAELSEIG